MSDEKTEEPTEKKLKDARRDGETAKSTDLPFAALLICASIGFSVAGPSMAEQLRLIMRAGLDVARAESPDLLLRDVLLEAAMHALLLLLPIAAVAILACIAALASQVGFQVSFKPIEPKFDSLNPASGLKRIFSLRSMIDLAKAVVKAVVISAVIYKTVRLLMPLMVGAVYEPLPALDGIAWGVLCKVLGIAGVLYLIIGAVDYGIQHWLFIRDHRMSKDEVKREHKENEGDPHIKGERRKIAREIAMSAPERPISKANVVVVNPTHYAVALYYDPGEYGLPQVIAKGVDEHAHRIREEAMRHGVPIVGNPPLARALYLVPINNTIPALLFESVAEVLAWVETIGSRRDGGGMPN